MILALAAAGVTARDVQLDSSNLEDAFVRLTGKHLSKEGAHVMSLSAAAPAAACRRDAPFGKIVLNEARLTWRRPTA